VNSEPTLKITDFHGLVNVLDADTMPPGALTQADNVDVNDQKKLRTREGYLSALSFSGITAHYQNDHHDRLFVIRNGTLSEIVDGPVANTLTTGMDPGETYWAESAGIVVVSNKAGFRRISGHDEAPLAVPTPDQPEVSRIAGGLPAGRYQVTVANIDATGRESPAPLPVVIDLEDGQGLSIGWPDDGYTRSVFASHANGDRMYLVTETDGGYNLLDDGAIGPSPLEIDQLGADGPPNPGGPVTIHDGCLYVAEHLPGQDMTALFRSRPYWWHLFDLEEFDPIPGRVELLDSTPSGLIVGTDREIYAIPADGSLVRLADYGVTAGPNNLARIDKDTVAFWSARGLCVGLPFANLTEERVSLPPGLKAAVSLIERNGFKKIVVLTTIDGMAYNSH